MEELSVDFAYESDNPLDLVEEVAQARDWYFDRASHEELAIRTAGRWCDYITSVVWITDVEAMHVACVLDVRVPDNRRREVADLLTIINDQMWLGHFQMAAEDGLPSFRHTLPLRGNSGPSVEQIEDVIDAGLTECERFYPAFQLVIWGNQSAAEAASASLFDTQGEA